EHGQVAEDDNIGVRHRAFERIDETLGLQDLVPSGCQSLAVAFSAIAIIRDDQDPRYAAEGIHVMTSCLSFAAAGLAVRPTAAVRLGACLLADAADTAHHHRSEDEPQRGAPENETKPQVVAAAHPNHVAPRASQ